MSDTGHGQDRKHPGPEAQRAEGAPHEPQTRVWCEVCGREAVTTAEEAFDAGWDFAGPGGTSPAGVLTPRKCGNCSLDQTVWWRLVVDHAAPGDLTPREREVVARILRETESLRSGAPTDANTAPAVDVDAEAAAELLGVDTPTLQQLVSNGELSATSNVGEPLTLRRGDVIAYRNLLHERRSDFIAASSATYEEVVPEEAARLAREARASSDTKRT